MKFARKFRLRFLQKVKYRDSAVSLPCIVLRSLALETWSIPAEEVLKDDADAIACFANSDCLEHSRTPQLLEHIMRVEICRCELIVRLQAANVPRLTLPQGHNKRGKLLPELIRQRVAFQALRLPSLLLEEGLVDGADDAAFAGGHDFSD